MATRNATPALSVNAMYVTTSYENVAIKGRKFCL
jgi:hypothetical protein